MRIGRVSRRRAGWSGLGLKPVLNTTTQANGFAFSSAAGARFYLLLTRNIPLNCGHRYRHMSNADLKLSNGGINSHIGLLGVSFFF